MGGWATEFSSFPLLVIDDSEGTLFTVCRNAEIRRCPGTDGTAGGPQNLGKGFFEHVPMPPSPPWPGAAGKRSWQEIRQRIPQQGSKGPRPAPTASHSSSPRQRPYAKPIQRKLSISRGALPSPIYGRASGPASLGDISFRRRRAEKLLLLLSCGTRGRVPPLAQYERERHEQENLAPLSVRPLYSTGPVDGQRNIPLLCPGTFQPSSQVADGHRIHRKTQLFRPSTIFPLSAGRESLEPLPDYLNRGRSGAALSMNACPPECTVASNPCWPFLFKYGYSLWTHLPFARMAIATSSGAREISVADTENQKYRSASL